MEMNMDRFIEYALQNIETSSPEEELEYYRRTKPILRDEILTCYQYLKEKGLLDEYKAYRG